MMTCFNLHPDLSLNIERILTIEEGEKFSERCKYCQNGVWRRMT
jgi:hypothetical protein